MYDSGYRNINNMDISSVVIDQMWDWNSDWEEMNWEVMDVWDLKYDDNTFDIAIDKSTIDALLCGDDAFINVAKMTHEVSWVLRPGGIYFVVSYGNPETRMSHFKRDHLDFKVRLELITPADCITE